MKKIMFNDKYGLTAAVLQGRKTMTRRIAYDGEIQNINTGYITEGVDAGRLALCDGCMIVAKSNYKIGEVVAVAQKYLYLCNCDAFYQALEKADPTFPLECIKGEKGCHNKMFVKAEWMPHRIRITNIKVERLQDISDEDCLKEGIYKVDGLKSFLHINGYAFTFKNWWQVKGRYNKYSDTPRGAFAALIDKISGKGTWNKNPFVVAYTFELVI